MQNMKYCSIPMPIPVDFTKWKPNDVISRILHVLESIESHHLLPTSNTKGNGNQSKQIFAKRSQIFVQIFYPNISHNAHIYRILFSHIMRGTRIGFIPSRLPSLSFFPNACIYTIFLSVRFPFYTCFVVITVYVLERKCDIYIYIYIYIYIQRILFWAKYILDTAAFCSK